MKKRIIAIVLVALMMALALSACEGDGAYQDTYNTMQTGNSLQENQPTPTSNSLCRGITLQEEHTI